MKYLLLLVLLTGCATHTHQLETYCTAGNTFDGIDVCYEYQTIIVD